MTTTRTFLVKIVLPVVLATFVVFKNGASGLKCYKCNTHTDPYCGAEHLPQSLVVDCDEADPRYNHTMCRKILQVVEYEVGDAPPDTRIIRECGWDDSRYYNKCYHRSGFGGKQEICSCTEDLCNSSPPPVSISTLTTTIAAVALAVVTSTFHD